MSYQNYLIKINHYNWNIKTIRKQIIRAASIPDTIREFQHITYKTIAFMGLLFLLLSQFSLPFPENSRLKYYLAIDYYQLNFFWVSI